jgi:hypothetical protein
MRYRDVLARHTSPHHSFRPLLFFLRSVGLLAPPSVVVSQAACVLAAGTRVDDKHLSNNERSARPIPIAGLKRRL